MSCHFGGPHEPRPSDIASLIKVAFVLLWLYIGITQWQEVALMTIRSQFEDDRARDWQYKLSCLKEDYLHSPISDAEFFNNVEAALRMLDRARIAWYQKHAQQEPVPVI